VQHKPVTELGWFLAVLVGVMIMGTAVGGVLFYIRKRKKDVAVAKARKAKRPVKKSKKGGTVIKK